MGRGNPEALENRRQATIVLKELREHQQEVDADKEEATDVRSDALTQHFEKAAQNLEKTITADQALVDAQIFHKLGVYSKRQAEQLQTGLRTYDTKTFTDNLIAKLRRANVDKYDDEEGQSQEVSVNFLDIGRSVHMRWKTAPALDFMYGNAPKDSEKKSTERKRAQRIKKGGPTSKPSELRPTDLEETETDKQVAEMKRELQKRKRCNYWMFVIDPNSFARSVENVFHSSFLVKERFASLNLKNEIDPTIRYFDASQSEGNRVSRSDNAEGSREVSNSQLIMGFDRNVWREMIRKHNIRQCLFPSKTLTGLTAEMRKLQEMEDSQE